MYIKLALSRQCSVSHGTGRQSCNNYELNCTITTSMDIQNMLCEATVTYSVLHMTRAQQRIVL